MNKIMAVEDMIWRCIKIDGGKVYYFNDAGILVDCSIDEAFSYKISGISKKSIFSHATVTPCSMYGITESEDFEKAAARAHLGCSVKDFIKETMAIHRNQKMV